MDKVNPDVDPQLARIVNRALSPKVKRRPPDALSFYQQLKLYLRDTGVAIDAQAMSRYVAEVTGSAPSGKQSAVDDSSFRLPEYKVPMGPSPTQRFERRDRQRARARPFLIIGALLVLGAIAFGAYRLGMRDSPPPPVHEAPKAATGDSAGDTASDTASKNASDTASKTASDTAEIASGTASKTASDTASGTPKPADDGIDFELSDVDTGAIEVGDMGDPATRLRALVHRGRQQLRRGRHESALEAYQRASALKPEHAPARLGQANALLALERYDEAEKQVNLVLERKPKNHMAFLILGDIMAARGDAAQARWAYERCLKVAPPESKAARSAKKALSKL